MSACPVDLDAIDVSEYEDIEIDADLQDLPQEVKDCAESVKADNPSMDKSTAIAICRDQLDMGQELSGLFQLAGVDTAPIEREQADDDTVIYRNVKILQSGVWTDGNSRETIWYSPRGLDNMEVTDNNAVNLMHDDGNEVMEAGSIIPDSLEAVDGSLFADIELDTAKTAGKLADDNLQKTLETGGAKGFGGPSVEIAKEGQEIEYNDSKGLRELVKGLIDGLGFVSNPASKPVSFARQVADRGVALSDSEQSTKVFRPKNGDMVDAETKQQVLAAADFESLTLQGAMDAIQDDAQAIADELDVGIDEVLEVLDPLLDVTDEEDEEEEEREEQADEEEEEETEDEDEAEEDDEMDMADRVAALEERLTNLEDMAESLMAAEDVQEELSDVADAETVQELQDAKDELDRRLSDLEDEPGDRKTKADRELGERENGEEPPARPVATKARDGSVRF